VGGREFGQCSGAAGRRKARRPRAVIRPGSGLWPGKVVTKISEAGPFRETEAEDQDCLQHYPDGKNQFSPQPGRKTRRAGRPTLAGNTCNNLGTVLGQSPLPGTHVSIGSAVSITIDTPLKHPCPKLI
jgi:hypothetical protein